MMEGYAIDLGLIANIAAIFTAVIATFGYGAYRWRSIPKTPTA